MEFIKKEPIEKRVFNFFLDRHDLTLLRGIRPLVLLLNWHPNPLCAEHLKFKLFNDGAVLAFYANLAIIEEALPFVLVGYPSFASVFYETVFYHLAAGRTSVYLPIIKLNPLVLMWVKQVIYNFSNVHLFHLLLAVYQVSVNGSSYC